MDITDIKLNTLQQKAYDLVLSKKNVFITGAGGVGKSLVIKKLKKDLETKYFTNVAITSTTGISAMIIGGTTLHSHLGIGLGVASYKKLLKKIRDDKKLLSRWTRMEVLIIDEVSMLTIELFEKLERLGRNLRKDSKPFGGIQIILTGDFCQIPPVGSPDLLFESPIWDLVVHETIYLTQIMRQTDESFMRILNKVRLGDIDEEVETILKSREIKYHSTDGILPTMLYSINSKVDATNQHYYDKLESEEHHFKIMYKWHKSIIHKEKYDPMIRFAQDLYLKIGTQVMFLINADGLVNGSRGIITKFVGKCPVVLWDNGTEAMVSAATLDIEENDDKILSYSQIPLKLAYAATIHKAQGSTISLARINITRIFEFGQFYVAISRVRNLESLYLKNLNFALIKANPKAVEFYKNLDKK